MTETGNTKKLAEAIHSEVAGDKDIKEMQELLDLDGYDFAFIGFPIHNFGPPKQVRSFLQKRTDGKKVALFITHGAPEDFEDVKAWIDGCVAAAKNADIVGVFNCQGEKSDKIIDLIKKSKQPKLRSFARNAHKAKGRPNAETLKSARIFARNIIEKLQTG
jgi:flavodoxin